MKKLAILSGVLFASFQANAQALNEVEWNVFNTIVQQSVEIGYEHFIDKDQSVGVDLNINDRFSYYGENKKEGKYKKFNTNSIALNYICNFGVKDNENAKRLYIKTYLQYQF